MKAGFMNLIKPECERQGGDKNVMIKVEILLKENS